MIETRLTTWPVFVGSGRPSSSLSGGNVRSGGRNCVGGGEGLSEIPGEGVRDPCGLNMPRERGAEHCLVGARARVQGDSS